MPSSFDATLTWQRNGEIIQQNIFAQIDSMDDQIAYEIYFSDHRHVQRGDEFIDQADNAKYVATAPARPFPDSHLEIPVKLVS